MSVLRSETEGRRVLVVDLVDMLVKGAPVKCLVGYSEHMRTGHTSRLRKARTEEVEDILEDEEGRDLRNHNLPCREGHLPCRHAEHLCHGVEEPDLEGCYLSVWGA